MSSEGHETVPPHGPPEAQHGFTSEFSFKILELPGEIVQEALLFLQPSHILHFALTCHHCHDLSVPILNQSIVLAGPNHNTVWQRIGVGADDPRNKYVRIVQLGTGSMARFLEDFWILEYAVPRLKTFSQLQELVSRAPNVGWQGYETIIKALGDRLRSLRLEVLAPNGTTLEEVPWIHEHSFSRLHTLDLCFVAPVVKNDTPNILPILSTTCPVLKHLKVSFEASRFLRFKIYDFDPVQMAPPGNYFPFLESFSLDAADSDPEAEELEMGIHAFLERHSATLREFAIPYLRRKLESGAPLHLKLRKLGCNLKLAYQLSESDDLGNATLLEDLALHRICFPSFGIAEPVPSMGASSVDVDVLEERWRYKNVKSLTMFPQTGDQSSLFYQLLPRLFPELQRLTLHLYGGTESHHLVQEWNTVARYTVVDQCYHLDQVKTITKGEFKLEEKRFKVIRDPEGRAMALDAVEVG